MKLRTKQRVMRIFLCCEILFFTVYYRWGSCGAAQYQQLRQDNVRLEGKSKRLMAEIIGLKRQAAVWNSSPFFKEKLAREQLQMARKNDHIYYIG
jgi:cell division protein FtsB